MINKITYEINKIKYRKEFVIIGIDGRCGAGKTTLADEYYRDLSQGKDIDLPKGYFRNDDPDQGIMFRWRSHANLLFSNWLNYYLYQAVPYNLDDLRDGKEDAWREAFADEKVEI